MWSKHIAWEEKRQRFGLLALRESSLMEEMGQDNSFQAEREGNDPFSTSVAGKARSIGHKLQREGPGRESKRKYEDSKELDKNICGEEDPSSLVRCFCRQGRQATTRNGLSNPGASQGVFQLCLLWFHNVCIVQSCRNDATFAESMGQWENKLVVHHHVCVDAHGSFSTDNQQIHHPHTYLRTVKPHFSVVLCDDWKKEKIIMASQECPWASWQLPQLSCTRSSLASFWGASVVLLIFLSVSLSR